MAVTDGILRTASDPIRTAPDPIRFLQPTHSLPAPLRELIAASFEERSFAFGEYLMRSGELPDAVYVVIEGVARLIANGPSDELTLGMVAVGESVGAFELLESEPASTSVRASGPLLAARLDRSVFLALVRLHPELGTALMAEGQARRLEHTLRRHPAFGQLAQDELTALLSQARPLQLAAGEECLLQGELADSWFLVKAGQLVLSSPDGPRGGRRSLRAGDIFSGAGRLREPGAASVTATSGVKLVRFSGASFDSLLRNPRLRARVDECNGIDDRAAPRPSRDLGGVVARPPLPRSFEGAQLVEPVAEPEPWKCPRRFPWVRQIDEVDCGAACVAMLCRAFGHRVSLAFVRQAVRTSAQGTTLDGIKRGGERLGLEVKAIKSSTSRLNKLQLPAIIHWDSNHWVVLYRVDSRRGWIADPGRGLRSVTISEVRERWSGYAATARPTRGLAAAPLEKLELRWLWPFIVPHQKRIAVAIALAVIAVGAQLLPPILSKSVIDAVIAHKGLGAVNGLIALMALVLLISLGISLLQRRILARLAVDLDSDSLDFVTGRLLTLPLSYFESRRTGDIERRLNGLRDLRQLLVQNIPGALAGAVQLVVTLVIMFLFSWVIGLAFLATAPLHAALMRMSSRRLKPTFDSLEEAYGRHASKQLDAIKGIESVKTAGAEPEMRRRILEEFTRLADKVFNADFVLMSYDAAVQLAGYGIFVLFLWIAAVLAVSGSLTIGEVVAVNSFVLLANAPILMLLNLWDRMQKAAVLLQRLQDVLEQEAEQPETPGLRSVARLGGNLAVRRLALVYPDAPDRRVLDEVSFTLEPGMSLGLVGRSGSGKSTLLRCLAGLLVPTAGTILYDGVDLHQLRWGELRKRIGFVLQEPYLFDDTIAANIAIGESEPDWDRVVRAAEIADAAEFIEELPFGYMTRIGDSGMRVSGGQGQRLAIARALYHEPSIVLFDEATSALDTESERTVHRNLERVMTNRTAVVVAHRLSTVRNADVIGVLDQGRLVEWGSHAELMARGGLYFHLTTAQVAA